MDTNVLVSALAFGGIPLSILVLGREGGLKIYTSPFILAELDTVLRSRKLGWQKQKAAQAIHELSLFLRIVEPNFSVDVIQADPSDNQILACGITAHAEVIVTGNMKHIRPLGKYRGIEILTPHEFATTYFPQI